MGTLDNNPDGVDAPLANESDLDSYRQAEEAIGKMQVPMLLNAANPHERMYVAALDGTGNSMSKDSPENWSVVAKTYEQVRALKDQGVRNIAGGYVEGTFTQDNPVTRNIDGLTGFTFERRVETAYLQFCEQAKKWIDEDPQAQIRVAGVGFSRGAEEVAALTRMIEERGIQDPRGARVVRDGEDLVTQVKYTNPPLVAPGKTMQAVLLYDPVATGVKEHDRRLPPSVVSVLQITAEDEARDPFKSTNHIPPGWSDGMSSLNLTVAGCHSDIGDTYRLNGLGIRSFNLGVDYLNALSDRPFLQKRAVPDDPAMSVIHRSEQHMSGLYTTFGYRDGVRDRHNDLGPSVLCQRGEVRDCTLRQPIDPELEKQLERRAVPVAPTPTLPQHTESWAPLDQPPSRQAAHTQSKASALDASIDQLYAATKSIDGAAWLKESQAVTSRFLGSAEGQSWQQEVKAYEQARQDEAQVLLAQQTPEAPSQKPHSMRM
ncbi:DUF2235 domain-containing protein [Pseudoxanthomonas sp. CF125]|uniref:phospholipase effector Tle1 domain-containing protein n=1 Tax=Pseudoxanthomonas sp. CF125 TaxID=1855303 RepID=UPI00087ED016|nr:DUF2235 domain-containing protein [Pseudoxanthomonas sp. CF125]SDQ86817.1 Uncharacterized alpha/beta hydrolase domain [Pseudoxanthomonas sp. CF125]